ncbi:hypothetical protein HanIR_Chr01g0018281 [Helianthus annuus]|nr:hypothetical protein HanIR_Chr01g0018281 [Helianthus annuus]
MYCVALKLCFMMFVSFFWIFLTYNSEDICGVFNLVYLLFIHYMKNIVWGLNLVKFFCVFETLLYGG